MLKHPPSSEDVDAMKIEDVSSWLMRLIGSDGRCESGDEKRAFLKKYLEHFKNNPSLQSINLPENVDSLPYKKLVETLSSLLGDFGNCKDEKSQRELLTGYSNKRKNKSKVVLKPKRSNWEDLPYDSVLEILKYHGIKISGYENINRMVLEKLLFPGFSMVFHEQKVHDMVQFTIRKYKKVKEEVIESYVEIKDIIEKNLFSKQLDGPLQEMFPNYMDTLKAGVDMLKEDNANMIEIVVIGETSSGKSTFLNVLLGENILPSHILHTTSCLCRLHNSPMRMVSYQTKEGTIMEVNLDGSSSEVNNKLETIVGNKGFDGENMNVVDLYWPIPVLQENIVLVDTPGIGEKYRLTEQVVKLIPKAAGYILILNASNAGGVQEDRILKVLLGIRNADKEKRPLNNILFVCNKWDTISDKMRKDVMKDTKFKLENLCGEVKPWQVFKFSASQELTLRQLEAHPSKDFETLLEGFEFLMVESAERRIGSSHQWIFKFLVELQNFVDTRATASTLADEDLNPRVRKARSILHEATINLEPEILKMKRFIDKTAENLSDSLKSYIGLNMGPQEEQHEHRNWRNSASNVEDLHLMGPKLVSAKLCQIRSQWSETGPLNELANDIQQNIDKIEKDLESKFQSIHELGIVLRTADSKYTSFTQSKEGFGSLWSRIAGYVREFATDVKHIMRYVVYRSYDFWLSGQAKRKKTFEQMLNILSNEEINKFINEEFTYRLNTSVEDLHSSFKRKTNAMHSILNDIERDNKDCASVFEKLQEELRAPSLKIRKISVEYFSPVSVSCETLSIKQEPVSITGIADLYVVSASNLQKPVTLRAIHPHFADVHIREFPQLRLMKHKNFITYEGIVFSMLDADQEKARGYSANTLNFLIEQCTGDLETHIFKNRQSQGCVGSLSAEAFFMKTASGIIDGLSFIHENNFVHGHLQLSSVLLTSDMTPKLCDINVSPQLSGTQRDICIFHTAPEVTKQSKYDSKADIYSFGILLWELWYGKHAGGGDDRNTVRHLKPGYILHMPQFESVRPIKALETFIKSCCESCADDRPDARKCIQTLKTCARN